MSVINQVLNDIEQQSKINNKPPLGPLEPIQIKEPSRFKSIYIIIGLLLMLSLGVAWWLSADEVVVKPALFVEPTPVVDKKIIDNSSKHSPSLIPDQNIEKPSTITKKNITEKASDKKNSDNLQDTLPVQQNVLKKAVNKKISNPEIAPIPKKLDVISKAPAEDKTSLLSITPVKMSDIEVAQLKLKQGIKAQSNGRIDTAQQRWEEALVIRPDLHEARLQLAASIYGANETAKAISLMVNAIRQFPQYDGYRLLTAQIYYQEKQPTKALAVLNSPFNKVDVKTENLILAASLAQQLQQWPDALSNYQVLVRRDISNSQWLLGLAIASDALDKKEEAYQHYARLMKQRGVDRAIQEYAGKRISILKTSIDARGHNG